MRFNPVDNSEGLPKIMPDFIKKRLNEASFILILTLAIYLLISLTTYRFNDSQALLYNAGGKVGYYFSQYLYYLLGYMALVIPLGLLGLARILSKISFEKIMLDKNVLGIKAAGILLFILSSSGLLSLHLGYHHFTKGLGAGGVIGDSLAVPLYHAFNIFGANLLLLCALLIAITFITGVSWVYFIERLGFYSVCGLGWLKNIIYTKAIPFLYEPKLEESTDKVELSKNSINSGINLAKPIKIFKENIPKLEVNPLSIENISSSTPPLLAAKEVKVETLTTVPVRRSSLDNEAPIPRIDHQPFIAVTKPIKTNTARISTPLPILSLLESKLFEPSSGGYSDEDLEMLSREVEQHLLDFGIQADVVAVHPGPVIIRFELQLAAGIKVSKLSSLSKDLARSLSVISVRVVEVIPGKTVVGLELPNQQRAIVRLSEVLSSNVYQQAHSPLTLALGVDIAGHPMVVDLAKMPHLLIAGTTGSGKSVGVNAMILSLLFKSSPSQVRLIMIDPKMLELSIYDGIPHLLTPVVTDMKEAASALRWCVGEMERRYRLMANMGVRNLAGFNAKILEAIERGEPLFDTSSKANGLFEAPVELEVLPYIVVIIDELADMMMVVGKKVEQLIARIAQKARAAGIHLILATQRPSVDVLTGLIKSNIPTRIAFQVSSKIDSRTILDQSGAEALLGHGDMLYSAPGGGGPLRVHGVLVEDQEVHRVASSWREQGKPEYIEEITKTSWDSESSDDREDVETQDNLYDEAVEFVIQSRKASISAIQRRFKVGYNRAARLVEEMEKKGILGPLEGGFRDVLVATIEE